VHCGRTLERRIARTEWGHQQPTQAADAQGSVTDTAEPGEHAWGKLQLAGYPQALLQ
jgi:hypothetical protein